MNQTLSCLDQRESSTQLLALERYVDFTASELFCRRDAILRLVRSQVPYHDRSSSVLAGGNHPLELGIVERMVLRAHGQTLLSGVHGRPLGTAQDTRTLLMASRK